MSGRTPKGRVYQKKGPGRRPRGPREGASQVPFIRIPTSVPVVLCCHTTSTLPSAFRSASVLETGKYRVDDRLRLWQCDRLELAAAGDRRVRGCNPPVRQTRGAGTHLVNLRQ